MSLAEISVNNFGTRAVQKLIEVLWVFPKAIAKFSSSIKGDKLVELIKDNHGNHVVQQCLVKFPSSMTLFIFDIIIPNCIAFAQHRQGRIHDLNKLGCCVVQKCLEHGYEERRLVLIAKLIEYCETLIPDQYGNYVLQHIIDKKFFFFRLKILKEKRIHKIESDHNLCFLIFLTG